MVPLSRCLCPPPRVDLHCVVVLTEACVSGRLGGERTLLKAGAMGVYSGSMAGATGVYSGSMAGAMGVYSGSMAGALEPSLIGHLASVDAKHQESKALEVTHYSRPVWPSGRR